MKDENPEFSRFLLGDYRKNILLSMNYKPYSHHVV